MTVRVTTLKGADAGAYYVEQLPNSCLQSGEPRGVWLGDGAPMLGLAGEIVDDDFLALMAGMDPQRPDRHLGRRYDEKSARGYDVTAPAPKAVSILFDLPATSRQAELNETPPHRPGLRDGPVLRELMEERHAILARLQEADSCLQRLPATQRSLERDIADARKTVVGAEAEYRRAESVIDVHDRPLRRRKHEADIDAARRELQRQPEIARRAEAAIDAAENELARLAARSAEAKTILDRQPELESTVTEIDGRLAHDLRVRTRIARLEAPAAIIDSLGPRPRQAQEAQLWDHAAGRLHQHQAAFALHEGIGPWPSHLDRSVYAQSHAAIDDLIQPVQSVGPSAIARTMPELDLPGIEM